MRKFLIALMHLYQRLPVRHLSHCRYLPSCSHYAEEALEEWGALRGSYLAAKRVVRCNPFSSSGYDPVPLRSPEKSQ